MEGFASEHGDLNSVFLDTLSSTNETSWAINVMVEGEKVNFKVDTGVEITAISERNYRELKTPQLEKARRKLYGPERHPLRVIGQFNGKVSYNGKESIETIFVVAGLRTNLLDLPAIIALKLVARLAAISVSFWHSFRDWVILENLLIFICSQVLNHMHFSLQGISQFHCVRRLDKS